MEDSDQPETLPGGGLGGAIRVGDTVRRPTGPWTATIHSLLDHLNAVGLDGVPRALGIDEDGREVLEFLEGETVYSSRAPGEQGWPEWAYADALLTRAGQWLAR